MNETINPTEDLSTFVARRAARAVAWEAYESAAQEE